MKTFHLYRDKEACLAVAAAITKISTKPVMLMEVCGGHTVALQRYGIPSLLPPTIQLVSGPGCPVCVTHIRFIDYAIALSQLDKVTIATFGDLIRVPGSRSTLEQAKAQGRKVEIVYSPLDALDLARQYPEEQIVFLGIGFETTAPTSAAVLLEAQENNIQNFSVLSSHKIMPPAMAALITQGIPIDGYLCPGHVSVVTGSGIYEEIAKKFGKACVISGFEPLDILQSIYMLVRQIENHAPAVEIEYTRAVKPEGNPRARELLQQVFEPCDAWWRGLGNIPGSGLRIRAAFSRFDAEKKFPLEIPEPKEPAGCRCGDILKGMAQPAQCPLYKRVCTPQNPVGACMVSSEGTCAAFFQYGHDR